MEIRHNLEQTIDRDERSESLRRFMTKSRNIDGFQGRTVEEVFDTHNEQSRRELIETFSGDQYCQMVAGVNGILRGMEKQNWIMDGVGVTAAGTEVVGKHIFPRHENKKDILLESWTAAQRMNANGRNLEDVGMLLGSILVETHPFNDGNGRTSRLIYSMMKDGFSEERLHAILGEDGRFEFDMALFKIYYDQIFDKKYGRGNSELNSDKIGGLLTDVERITYGKLRFPDGVREETKANIIEAGRNDENIFLSAILQFLKTRKEMSVESVIGIFPNERKVFFVQNLLSALSAEQIEELETCYWSMKKQYTVGLIDLFENPDKPEYKIQKDGKEIRQIDLFKERIATNVVYVE